MSLARYMATYLFFIILFSLSSGYFVFSVTHRYLKARDICRDEIVTSCLADSKKEYECKVIAKEACGLL